MMAQQSHHDYSDQPDRLLRFGVLPSQEIRAFVRDGAIASPRGIDEAQIQPASIDLRLGQVAYELRSSFLPGGYSSIAEKLQRLSLQVRQLDLTTPTTLVPGHVYLVELLEHLRLPPQVWARANPRSTTGRLDVFTRLLCDYGTEFEGVPPGYSGKLYAELVPRTFAVRVQVGTRVNQLRFIHGAGAGRLDSSALVSDEVTVSREILSVDLTPIDASGIIGYRAKRFAPVLDFDCVGWYNRLDFWEPIVLGDVPGVVLQPDDFYILRSRERVRIPPDLAAELAPYDSSFGEFRVHYAGFLDPGFGYNKASPVGTPVVLEVRARDVPFLIEDGQRIGLLLYYRLRGAADKIYGSAIGSSYQDQTIALGKQFKQS